MRGRGGGGSCQFFWYNGVSKRFAEIMHSFIEIKIGVLCTY